MPAVRVVEMPARRVVGTASAMAWCMIERRETKWHVDGCPCRLCEREEMVGMQVKGGGWKLGDLIEQAICYQEGNMYHVPDTAVILSQWQL